MVCVDYSKAFDTIQFRSVVSKMHSVGFSKYFLLWMIDYLTQRRQLVQIDGNSGIRCSSGLNSGYSCFQPLRHRPPE